MGRFGSAAPRVETIVIGADHAGYHLKTFLKEELERLGYKVLDKGAFRFDEGDDYPDFIVPTVKEVLKNPLKTKAIIIGGSGQGEAMTANRFQGIRAVVFNGQYKPLDGRMVPHEIVISRQHNDANVLALGARFLSNEEAFHAVKLWLETPFSNDERHKRRLRKLENLTT
ncbi:MAG: ribose-5-phosphate isomerase [Candidatus Zambryskibacteria bacterium CG10_big_fil_rev_8_21_14_0_10_42_12]|uniref:Ribose-5-phosphate isomerase n=1 Tax=Candidatus Zambryskibacteria bacterium CG10_big_fil_rev_8_21_14_0_10_42_12 TaxID=1975115 RepID=A0A2H0QVV7_9BACT|nr:MAG: ribose-5-phosphate isomerase [Candidatus Zambryskibacteria bacterium CG10_big_fil_rev_8_21_14_0_10_42_12]